MSKATISLDLRLVAICRWCYGGRFAATLGGRPAKDVSTCTCESIGMSPNWQPRRTA